MKISLNKQAVLLGVNPILASIGQSSKYKDGKPTGETDGYRVTIVRVAGGMDMFTVKVPEGGIDLGGLTQEDIDSTNATGNFIRVDFTDFSARPYVDRGGNLALVCTASRVFLVDTNGKPKSIVPVKEV